MNRATALRTIFAGAALLGLAALFVGGRRSGRMRQA